MFGDGAGGAAAPVAAHPGRADAAMLAGAAAAGGKRMDAPADLQQQLKKVRLQGPAPEALQHGTSCSCRAAEAVHAGSSGAAACRILFSFLPEKRAREHISQRAAI